MTTPASTRSGIRPWLRRQLRRLRSVRASRQSRPQAAKAASPKLRPGDIHVTQLVDVSIRRSRETGYRLNLIVPSVDSSATFGGIRTALDLFAAVGADAPRRRIVAISPLTTPTSGLEEYVIADASADPIDPIQLVSIADSPDRVLAVGPQDVFVATFWTTAELAFRLRRWQTTEFGRAPARLGYVIQDFEPGFYPWSAQYLLALSTYSAPDQTVAMFNTELLRSHVHSLGIRFHHESTFEPHLPARLRAVPVDSPRDRARRIIVYGRPGKPRNAFPLIIDGLRRWRETYGGASDWTIVSAGQPHADIDLGAGAVVRSVGKLDLDDYAALLRSSAVGVSFMVSPHPSYPPLEMAGQGLLVLTNRFVGKDLSSWHDNITSLSEVSADGLARDLAILCDRFAVDPGLGDRGRPHHPAFASDDRPFPFAAEVGRLLRAGASDGREVPAVQ